MAKNKILTLNGIKEITTELDKYFDSKMEVYIEVRDRFGNCRYIPVRSVSIKNNRVLLSQRDPDEEE